MAKVLIRHGELIVEVEAVNRIWGLRCRLEIPLAHVVGASIGPALAQGFPGTPPVGGDRSAVLDASRFVPAGTRVFWDARDPTQLVAIDLADTRYTQLVVGVDDPPDVAARIYEALRSARKEPGG